MKNKKNTLIDTDFVEKISDFSLEEDRFIITTETNLFEIVTIDDNDPCTGCYLVCEDDYDYYKNAILYDIEIVDICDDICKYVQDKSNSGGHCFVNIITSKGQFQLTSYTEHNGYYGGSIGIYKNGELLEKQFLG